MDDTVDNCRRRGDAVHDFGGRAAGRRVDLHGRRIMIVEDEVLIAFGMECEILDAGGTVVGPAYSIAEALTLIDDDVDAAILDINIAGKQVWPVADQLLERNIPFVFASASCREQLATVPRYAAAPSFDKPTVMGQLLAALADLVSPSNNKQLVF